MRKRIALAAALSGLLLAHAGTAVAADDSKPDPGTGTAKTCTSKGGSWPPGTIMETTVTKADSSGNVKEHKFKWVCGNDGQWYQVVARLTGRGTGKKVRGRDGKWYTIKSRYTGPLLTVTKVLGRDGKWHPVAGQKPRPSVSRG